MLKEEDGAVDLGQKLLTGGGRDPVKGDWVEEFKVREGTRLK